jgi:hypothetical protein
MNSGVGGTVGVEVGIGVSVGGTVKMGVTAWATSAPDVGASVG